MHRLIAEPDTRKRGAYVNEIWAAYQRRDITPEQMIALQAASMPWCEACRVRHALAIVDNRHLCLPCYKDSTEG